jgi:hypothetical protein
MTTIQTPYGTATIGEDSCHVDATHEQLYDWAHRPGSYWPCSELASSDGFGASFDSNGVYEYRLETIRLEENLSGDELSAWTSDVLKIALPADHPCYFVCVGQFEDGTS